ncbi:hypothetical protein BC939DRAFT_507560 [Gamsiella multidivaricata]|uniref:uncharacterized protein n=1 Tax=Gamsiella multidivaricata TaxID=101098 RepID=UPI00221FE7F4|nr:uncharacterized protein BC939DRAFT_507560 [Gamsiella multidivaricata]KAI7817246.1 hypothetical protein BC939DRAFT_507560 [Gamsiella multidivaricata]
MVQVMSAVVKLKQYTSLHVKSVSKSDTNEVLTVQLKDGWPLAEAYKSWQRTVAVPMPTAPQVASTVNSPVITEAHRLKLIMQVKIGELVLTAPRPPGDHYPVFDLKPVPSLRRPDLERTE